MTGNGSIEANGGQGHFFDYGSGSGGRIAIHCANRYDFAGTVSVLSPELSVKSGTPNPLSIAACGTIYWSSFDTNKNDLVLDGGDQVAPHDSTITASISESVVVDSVELISTGRLSLTADLTTTSLSCEEETFMRLTSSSHFDLSSMTSSTGPGERGCAVHIEGSSPSVTFSPDSLYGSSSNFTYCSAPIENIDGCDFNVSVSPTGVPEVQNAPGVVIYRELGDDACEGLWIVSGGLLNIHLSVFHFYFCL